MNHGVSVEVVWFDQDSIEVMFTCSNGGFAGATLIYLTDEELVDAAAALQGFPCSGDDSREVEIGARSAADTSGGARMRFYCRDSAGHAVVEVRLRADGCPAYGEAESVALVIPVEAAGVDTFLAELRKLTRTVGTRAVLPAVS